MVLLKKRYVLILSILFVILSMSCVSAIDNGTDVVKEQNNDLISVNEQENDTVSLSNENESVSISVETNSSNLNETDNGDVLSISENSDILSVSSSDNVLNSSVSVSSAYKEPTKKQRTFNIGGFKVVLSKAHYKKLYRISPVEDYFFEDDYNYYYVGEKYKGYDITSSGLRTYVTIKTNKYVKVKLKRAKKTYYKKSRVYMLFSYGQGQSGVAYKHIVQVVHYYGCYDRSYDYVKVLGKNAKYFNKCKCSGSFTKLNKSKLYNKISIYKKFSRW